jgi:riboflavin kinase/FMN adenylyltransferase
MLGRPYAFDFRVEHGAELARSLGLPTINQPYPEGYALPRFGVYASVAEVAGDRLPAVTNIGVKPTVGGTRVLAETHIPGFDGDLYGQSIKVELLSFLRDEEKFPDINALARQMRRDAQNAAKAITSP